jgi:hypothetical protein
MRASPFVALAGAALPGLLVGSVYLWWIARGRPPGGDVLWFYVLGLVPSAVLGLALFAGGLWAASRPPALTARESAVVALAWAVFALDLLVALGAIAW